MIARDRSKSFEGKATAHGKGFAVGTEVEDETYASDVLDTCRENGLLIFSEEDVLVLFPALHTQPRHRAAQHPARPLQGRR